MQRSCEEVEGQVAQSANIKQYTNELLACLPEDSGAYIYTFVSVPEIQAMPYI